MSLQKSPLVSQQLRQTVKAVLNLLEKYLLYVAMTSLGSMLLQYSSTLTHALTHTHTPTHALTHNHTSTHTDTHTHAHSLVPHLLLNLPVSLNMRPDRDQ